MVILGTKHRLTVWLNKFQGNVPSRLIITNNATRVFIFPTFVASHNVEVSKAKKQHQRQRES